MVAADQSSRLIFLLCRLSRVEPALRTNDQQVRNSVSAEGRGQELGTDPGLMPLCCKLCPMAFSLGQSSLPGFGSFVQWWCANGGSGDENGEIRDL